MQVDIKQLDPVNKELTITVEAPQAQAEYQKYLAMSAKRIQIPGFRKGKAPLARVEREYKESIVSSFLEYATDKYFEQVVQEHQLVYLYTPMVNELKWEDEQELIIVVNIEHEPPVEIIFPEPFEVPHTPKILETEVEKILVNAAYKNRNFLQVEKAIENDTVFGHLTVLGINDTEPLTASLAAGEITSEQKVKELLGASVGDTIKLSLNGSFIKRHTLEPPYALDDEREYDCTVMVNEIMRIIVPEIDDDFAKDLGFENLIELRKKIAEEINLGLIHKNMEDENNSIIQTLFMAKPFKLPQRTLDHIVSSQLEELPDRQYIEYYEKNYRMDASLQFIKLFITKALRKHTGFELKEGMVEQFIEHRAILEDQTVELWKEQNTSDMTDPELVQQATDWFMLRDLASKATFVDELSDQDNAEQADEEE